MFDQIVAVFQNTEGNLTWVGKIVLAIVVYLISRIVYSVLKRLVNRIANRNFSGVNNSKKKTVLSALMNFFKYLLYFIVITVVLEVFGIDTTSIIATAGIGGIAIAFGAQQVIQDLISGVFIILEDQFNVGDYVNMGDVTGTVIEIGLRKTKVRNYVGSVSLIPNSQIKTVTNFGHQPLQSDINVAIPYTVSLTTIDEILQVVKDRAMSETPYFTTEPYLLGVEALGDRTYTVIIGSMVKNGEQWNGPRFLRKAFLEELEKRHIKRAIEINEDVKEAQRHE